MSKTPDKPEDHASPEAQPDEEERRSLCDVDEDELKEILEAHVEWLLSHGKDGEQANLSNADLQGANLSDAKLNSANLQGANLHIADLQGANLSYANLQGANLQGADLRFANLEEARLGSANLQEASLNNASLQGANFFAANLRGADLFLATGLTQKQLDKACGDAKTKLPDYLKDYEMKPCPKESK